MNGLLITAVFFFVAATCVAQKVEFHDCGSQLSTINEVDIFPCPSLPCVFKQNSNVTLTVNLTPSPPSLKWVPNNVMDGSKGSRREVNLIECRMVSTNYAAVIDAKSVVTGIIEGIPVPFPLPDENACNFMTCPLAPGSAVSYKSVINVRPEYPPTNLIVKWEVTSSSGEVFCFLVPATISS